jgi:hypothetical protein
MSTREIINELPKLTRPELEEVDAHLHELLRNGPKRLQSWGEALQEVAGTAEGLPDDFAHNHDHYLHGAPEQ